MLRIPGMPLLPGTLFRDVSKGHYPKPQSLLSIQGLSMLNDRQQPAPIDPNGDVVDISCPPVGASSIYPPRSGPRMPPWLAYDKKVLCFSAYFKQTLQEVYHAPYLIRKVKIYFYLEDGTLEIYEPRVDNSGIVQGCVVHRQRVQKTPPCDNEFMSLNDLNIDMTVQIFDRQYHIIDCDQFTRDFLNRRGITVPDSMKFPCDPSNSVGNREHLGAVNPIEKKHAFAQFLKYDRQILKFQAYWDDRTEFGDVRKLEICYYLADDTIEIKEAHIRNSGRDGPTVFLKRARLAREFNGLLLPGQMTPITLLNVLGTNMRNVRYCVDPLNTGNKDIMYYSERDLQIGSVINVYGRAVIITELDPFTQQYYRQRYGVQDFSPLAIPTRSDVCTDYRQKERILPPYNGWGSYEDSVGNCLSVEPKPPKTDFKKFIKFDRYVLRFGAKMLSTIKENCERIFVISYYLSDDTLQIQEVAVRNSGFLGGEFMKRTRIELPGQEKFSYKQPQYYMPWNFFIGSTMSLKDFIFHLVSADEYTLMFMEHHPEQFIHANLSAIMQKIRSALQNRMSEFAGTCVPDGYNLENKRDVFVSFESFKGALIGVLGKVISDHEIITLCRHFSAEQTSTSGCSRVNVKAAAHLELKRALWNARDDMMEHFHHINPTNQPFLPESKVRSTLRGCRLPFSLELIDNILLILNRNECNEIEICDLMNFIDVSCSKGCDMPPVNHAFELCPKIPFQHKGRLVNLSCFLSKLNLPLNLSSGTESGKAMMGDARILPPSATEELQLHNDKKQNDQNNMNVKN
ncbi:EF-hand domain-containing family member C2-like [Drosophila pseudoobscura]|uniref:EF-hand domain-containing family member C2-like n=1 Tax=Drosophila pseudoobscura pseudoobscura TaxID=46245 RepID=A0A6I8WAC1_DROPS|nr:EF-hand domain-containing family member C2 [Drosophila pseudoobscura]